MRDFTQHVIPRQTVQNWSKNNLFRSLLYEESAYNQRFHQNCEIMRLKCIIVIMNYLKNMKKNYAKLWSISESEILYTYSSNIWDLKFNLSSGHFVIG